MFVITNRDVDENEKGLDQLGTIANRSGPNALRVVEATKKSTGWKIDIIPDEIDDRELRKAKIKKTMDEKGKEQPVYASRYVAKKVLERVNPDHPCLGGSQSSINKGKNLLFFVHGFNNDIKDVLDRADRLRRNFGVEVIAFSWPADGGALGVTNYRGDKRDAKASVGALDRTLAKMREYLQEFQKEHSRKIKEKAEHDFKDNLEKRNLYNTKMSEKGCPFKINMLLHSMGNYLFKHLMKSGVSEGTGLLFDNVILAAADTNNANHAEWVDKIRCRNRIYITINEDDSALRASRIKAGEEQLARLGHYPHNLHSQQAVYVDFTDAKHVESSHAYFEGDALNNPKVKKFFRKAFRGVRAEEKLWYDSSSNMFKVKNSRKTR